MGEGKKRKLGILKQVESDAELKETWEKLSPESQEYVRLVDDGDLVPNLLSDSIFKTIFNPEISPERISKLVSSILGRDVQVVRSMDKEGLLLSENSKGVILDLVVEFLDGSVADVEIQRVGANMPPQRSAVNSANLLTRSYAVEKGKRKTDMDYTSLRPVYTIIIMEESIEMFRRSPECVHHFCQRSDTGVEIGSDFELLQYYDFVCLDVFRKKHPLMASMLEEWLEFLTIRETGEMEDFLKENESYREIYEQAIGMLAGRKELLRMFQDILADEDIKKTIYYTFKHDQEKLQEQIRSKDEQLREQSDQIRDQRVQLRKKDEQLQSKDERIRQLEEELKKERKR